jgi:hypothetical protein
MICGPRRFLPRVALASRDALHPHELLDLDDVFRGVHPVGLMLHRDLLRTKTGQSGAR